MSGRRINDYGGLPHTSDMAMKSKNSLKEYHSAEGQGHIGMEYPDTTEDVRRDQENGDKSIGKHKMRSGYRY